MKLSMLKTRLMDVTRRWDIVKKITNPYEMIYLTNKQHKKYSISQYEPISRSYFKMIEMMYIFF